MFCILLTENPRSRSLLRTLKNQIQSQHYKMKKKSPQRESRKQIHIIALDGRYKQEGLEKRQQRPGMGAGIFGNISYLRPPSDVWWGVTCYPFTSLSHISSFYVFWCNWKILVGWLVLLFVTKVYVLIRFYERGTFFYILKTFWGLAWIYNNFHNFAIVK